MVWKKFYLILLYYYLYNVLIIYYYHSMYTVELLFHIENLITIGFWILKLVFIFTTILSALVLYIYLSFCFILIRTNRKFENKFSSCKFKNRTCCLVIQCLYMLVLINSTTFLSQVFLLSKLTTILSSTQIW